MAYSLSESEVKVKSRSVMSDSLRPHGLYSPWNSTGQNTGVGSLSLLQGIFPTQGLNPGLPHCRRILYQLSYQGSFLIPSVHFSRSVVSDSSRPHESQHTRPPCPSPTPGVHLDSRPSSQWWYPAISSSVVPFSSCPQSLPASESFPMSQLKEKITSHYSWWKQMQKSSAEYKQTSTTVHEKNHTKWSSGIYSRDARTAQNIQTTVTHHVSKMKDKNNIIISIDTEKTRQNSTCFMIKT